MALFQHQDRQLTYQLLIAKTPQDCLLIGDAKSKLEWWTTTVQALVEHYKETDPGSSLLLAGWSDPDAKTTANDLVSLVDVAGLSDIAVIAFGEGAQVALQLMQLAPRTFCKAMLINPSRLEVTSISQPVVVALSEGDSSLDMAGAKKWATQVTGARIVGLKSLSKNGQIDVPQAIVDVLAPLLAEG